MRRSSLSVLALVLLLALSACNDESDSSSTMAQGFGGNDKTMALAAAPSRMTASDAGVFYQSPSYERNSAEMTIVDRSKLADKRIAETHSFSVELAANQIQNRITADYQACIALGCEVLASNYNSKSSGNLNARIAPDKLAAFFKTIESGLGEVKEHRVSVDDETNAYVDTAARLRNQTALRDRLTNLLQSDKTKTVSDVMQIERELTRVQSDIDAATGRMNALEKRTSMATVNVQYSVPYFERDDHYQKISTSFARAWRGFIQNLDEVIVFVGRVLPWLPIIVLGVWLAAKVLRSGFSAGGKFFRRKKHDNE